MITPDNAVVLTDTDAGNRTIVAHLGGRELTLRHHERTYRVGFAASPSETWRVFTHWRPAALAFAMLYHTEKSLSSLEGQA